MTELKDYHFYIIYCKSNASISYIGQTTDINLRKRCHKENCNNANIDAYHFKIYQTIRLNGGWDNWIMEQLSYQKGLTDLEARVTEQILLNDLGNLNEIKAYTSKEDLQKYNKEYRETHKEHIKEYRETHKEQYKKYCETHKEQIAEIKKKYYEKNKEQIAEQAKEYREKNAKELAEKRKKFYEKNAEQIKARQKEKVTCECGCIVARCELSTHRKTIKHLESFIKL